MRRHRIEYAGAVYHVMQRSSNREKIFGREADKKKLVHLLGEQKQKMGYRFYGYAIMDNHYHLILQTGSIPLSKIMHRVNFLYSKDYNHNKKRHGHVFGGRYKASLVQEEKYLFAVLRYVHQNPVRAGICKTVSEYRWSSDKAYRENDSSIIDIDFILNTLNSNRNNAISVYQKLMGQLEEIEFEKVKVIGEYDFVESKNSHIAPEYSKAKLERKSLDEILNNCGGSKEEMALILSGSRKRVIQTYKRTYALAAVEEGYTLKEIGRFIKISDAAVHRLLSK